MNPADIKRDGGGKFAATDGASLASGLAQFHAQAVKAGKGKGRKKKGASKEEKAVLKTIATGEDNLGDLFSSTEALQQVAVGLEQQGLIVNDGSGYTLTDAGKAAIATKKRRRY
jgi:hypothetical protein